MVDSPKPSWFGKITYGLLERIGPGGSDITNPAASDLIRGDTRTKLDPNAPTGTQDTYGAAELQRRKKT